MRPIKLSISAFGPYAETQVIDFRELEDRSIFLIHGPTGAGKSTILDALCYALYGETSGGERKGDQMRSHHAKPTTATEVTFDFALGADQYRVNRVPKQERPKGRGEGTTVMQSRATLWRKIGPDDFEREDEVIASNPREVGERIRDLFGFESEQFRQVIMLPQDQFRKLLKANSKEREEIFKALFQTEQFEKVEEALKDEADLLKNEINSIRDDRKAIFEQANVSSREDLDALLQATQHNLVDVQGELDSLRQREAVARETLKRAEEDDRKINEMIDAQSNLHSFEEKQAELEEKRRILDSARKAAILSEKEIALNRHIQDAKDAERRMGAAQIEWDKSVVAHKAALGRLSSEQQRENERQEAREKHERLRALYKRVEDLHTAQAELNATVKGYNAAQVKCDERRSNRDHLQHDLKTIQQRLPELEIAVSESLRIQLNVETVRNAFEQAKKLSQIHSDLRRENEIQSGLDNQLKQMRIRRDSARELAQEIEVAWFEGQAAILAQRLTIGEPCPVCGSIHHPQPALATHHLPTESEWKASREEAHRLEGEYEGVRSKTSEHREKLVRLEAEQKSLEDSLGTKKDISLKQLEADLKSAEEALTQVTAQEKQRLILIEKLRGTETELTNLEDLLKEAERDLQTAIGRKTSAETLVSERGRDIPEELRDRDVLVNVGKQAGERVHQLEAALKATQDEVNQTAQRTSAREAALKELRELATTTHQSVDQETEEFARRLQEVGFRGLEEYRQFKRSKQEIEILELEIRTFESSLAAAKDRAERASASAQGLIKPNLGDLRAACDQARKRGDSAAQEVTKLTIKLDQLNQQLANLLKIDYALDTREKRYRVIGDLSDVANGKNSLYLTFQRFVLAAKMDEVLTTATNRLQIMSGGRYLLQRVQSPIRGQRSSGLDLEVSDTWTGETTRAVETLSGGEGFLASLSLALGLADVVTADSGGIRLDTMFIDEGFGSLDAEKIDSALQALLSLKQGGRLIGIISHVDSLLERIDARLEISCGMHGSTARFVLG